MISEDELSNLYQYRYKNVLIIIASKLENNIKELLIDYPRIDRISARAKLPDSFIRKAYIKKEGDFLKYSEPLSQIQDQIGVRVITFYKSDVEPICQHLKEYLAPIEEQLIIPDSVKEFGYEGKHLVLFIPKEFITPDLAKEHCPTFFELQIVTLFEHAWAEANHDLAYKPQSELNSDQRRKVAFTAAQAWGADYIFDQLVIELARKI